MKAVFMGTPEFAAVVLKALYESDNQVALVLTQPDRARDRGKKVQATPVKELALQYDTPILQPQRLRDDAQVKERLAAIKPDVIVVAAYGQILPQDVLSLPRFGCVNVHASLLPKFRGASPIQRAIAEGEEKTGVTIMKMAAGLDTGDVLTQEETAIGCMTGGQLHDVLAEMGGKLLVKTLKLMEEGKVKPQPQDENLATYAGLIAKKDGEIDFSRPPEEVERMVRAYDPWPGAFCSLDGQMLKIWKARPLNEEAGRTDGEVVGADVEGLKAACGGRILLIEELQAPGKKRMTAADYLRGRKIEPGTRLG